MQNCKVDYIVGKNPFVFSGLLSDSITQSFQDYITLIFFLKLLLCFNCVKNSSEETFFAGGRGVLLHGGSGGTIAFHRQRPGTAAVLPL